MSLDVWWGRERRGIRQNRIRHHSPINEDDLIPTDEKPKGPASYFPSIEKKYGQPIEHWLELARGRKELKHMDLVNWFKTEHGLGHGHANAIVAVVLAEKK